MYVYGNTMQRDDRDCEGWVYKQYYEESCSVKARYDVTFANNSETGMLDAVSIILPLLEY